ncbi:MAG: LAGLIDADG family homing endonuclease [Candidatus Aenigmarchaeota archaeon]|nr:LAGLIDADG family homing endonuclease [Candidatus Aenigmarchaeota archaeon]
MKKKEVKIQKLRELSLEKRIQIHKKAMKFHKELGLDSQKTAKDINGYPTRKSRDIPIQERINLHRKALRLHQKFAWGKVRIGKALNLNPNTVENWIHKGVNPSSHFTLFTPKISKEISYVIGVAFGDGSATKTGYIHLTSIDREFVEKFAHCMTKILEKTCPIRESNGLPYVWIGCKLLCNFLKKQLSYLRLFIENFPKEFIQGFADSEGSPNVTIYKDRGRGRFDVRVIVACNTNRAILKYVQNLLKNHFNIKSNIPINVRAGTVRISKGHITRTTKDAWRLTIDRFPDTIKFARNIGFSIKRKQEKLIDAIKVKQKYGRGQEAIHKWLAMYQKVGRKWIKRK